jgi:hypothetical protein
MSSLAFLLTILLLRSRRPLRNATAVVRMCTKFDNEAKRNSDSLLSTSYCDHCIISV